MADKRYTIEEISALQSVQERGQSHMVDKSYNALKENWVFVIGLFAVGWWVITNTFSLQAGVTENARQINSAEHSISTLQIELDEIKKEQVSSAKITGEILTTVQLIQRDIADLKSR